MIRPAAEDELTILDDTEIRETVAGCRDAFDRGVTRPLEWRHRQLSGLIRMLADHEDELVSAIGSDLGRPAQEAWVGDIGGVITNLKHIRSQLKKWVAPQKVRLPMSVQPGSGWIQYEPLGVVLVIAPWNYPVQLSVEPMAAALAAGNAVVVKPSEHAPQSAAVMAELMGRYLDPDAIAVVTGGPDTAQSLLAERFDHIFYTGSGTVGRIVMRAAAEHLTPVTLELGGKSPAIVDRTADIDAAVHRIAWGRWFNAGQTCIAPDYVLIERDLRDMFVDRLQACVREFYGPNPLDSADYGRIVNEGHVKRLERLLAGETIAFGGNVVTEERYVSPTVVIDSAPDSPVMSEEIFGPILPVIAVDDMSEAIDFVRGRPKPLAMFLFTDDDDLVARVLDQTSSGGLTINHVGVHAIPQTLPFGGVGESGMGRYHGRSGFERLSNPRSVLKKPKGMDTPLLYPPYTKMKERVLRTVMR